MIDADKQLWDDKGNAQKPSKTVPTGSAGAHPAYGGLAAQGFQGPCVVRPPRAAL